MLCSSIVIKALDLSIDLRKVSSSNGFNVCILTTVEDILSFFSNCDASTALWTVSPIAINVMSEPFETIIAFPISKL